MAKYMFQGSYTQAGVAGLLKEGGSRRREALTSTIEGAGGTVETLYFAFGDGDVVIIADMPDDASATAVSLRISSSGVFSFKTVVLVTPETVDEAAKKEVSYRPPGA